YLVLLNACGLSRGDRRRRVSSRLRKFSAGEGLGFYCPQQSGQPAHIGIHVDRIIQRVSRLSLRVSLFRDYLFATILYHEVGHHIHRVLQPQYREPEDVADYWAERLRNDMLLRKYHHLTQEEWQRAWNVAHRLEHRRRRQLHV